MGSAPPNLNWNNLISFEGDETPPPEVVVMSNDDEGILSHLSDQQLQDKVHRVCSLIDSGVSGSLPDKGEKLLAYLIQWQDELDRRKLRARKTGPLPEVVVTRNGDDGFLRDLSDQDIQLTIQAACEVFTSENLPDKGKRQIMDTLLQWHAELERRKLNALKNAPEVVVILSCLSDEQIQEMIKSICTAVGSNIAELEKLRANLVQLQAESNRRKLNPQKVAEVSERARQSETTGSSDIVKIFSSPAAKPQQSSFVSLLFKKIEERADPASTCGWRSSNQGKCGSSKSHITGEKIAYCSPKRLLEQREREDRQIDSREMCSQLAGTEVNHDRMQVPETLEGLACGVDTHRTHNSCGVGTQYQQQQQQEEEGVNEWGCVPVDILKTQKNYTFFIEVPGLSKPDIQVTLEDDIVLVVKSNGKRKRDEEEEGCKYLRLESKTSPIKFMRKFRLPKNSNSSSVTARCDDGVLTVVVEKLSPPPEVKPKIVDVKIA